MVVIYLDLLDYNAGVDTILYLAITLFFGNTVSIVSLTTDATHSRQPLEYRIFT